MEVKKKESFSRVAFRKKQRSLDIQEDEAQGESGNPGNNSLSYVYVFLMFFFCLYILYLNRYKSHSYWITLSHSETTLWTLMEFYVPWFSFMGLGLGTSC